MVLSLLAPAALGLATGVGAAWALGRWLVPHTHSELAAARSQIAVLETRCARLGPERDRLGDMLAAMQEGVIALDKGGRILMTNAAFAEMFELEGDVAGQLPVEAVPHPDFGELLARGWGAKAAVSGEIELSRTDGTSRRLLVHATGLAGDGLLAVCVDVSELRRLELVRRDFVANVSHELRTPVATILSASETLESALVGDPEMALKLTEAIGRNARRMERLVEDLLDLARIESRQHRLPAEQFDVAAEIHRVVGQFQALAAEKQMALRAEPSPFLPLALADPGALEQILSNLLENAVKYGLEGGSVTVRARPEGRMVQVSVADSGPGIEAKHLPRLFERFYRIDSGRSRELGGTGLGLAIVKHLVEAMGGTASVESTVGRGTTFRFTLPRGPQDRIAPEERPE